MIAAIWIALVLATLACLTRSVFISQLHPRDTQGPIVYAFAATCFGLSAYIFSTLT